MHSQTKQKAGKNHKLNNDDDWTEVNKKSRKPIEYKKRRYKQTLKKAVYDDGEYNDFEELYK